MEARAGRQICPRCHRIQDSAALCAECGGQALIRWPAEDGALIREAVVGVGVGDNPQGWGIVRLFLLVLVMFGALVVPLLAGLESPGWGVVAFVGVGAAGMRLQHRRLQMKRRPRMIAAGSPPLALPPGRTQLAGTAHAHGRILPSLLSDAPCLASAVVMRRGSDPQVLLSRAETSEFWLHSDGDPLLVCGSLLLHGRATHSAPADSARARFALALGPNEKLPLDGNRLDEIVLVAGAKVLVEGMVLDEQRPDLGYRGGSTRVMRGLPGAPVLLQVVEVAP